MSLYYKIRWKNWLKNWMFTSANCKNRFDALSHENIMLKALMENTKNIL